VVLDAHCRLGDPGVCFHTSATKADLGALELEGAGAGSAEAHTEKSKGGRAGGVAISGRQARELVSVVGVHHGELRELTRCAGAITVSDHLRRNTRGDTVDGLADDRGLRNPLRAHSSPVTLKSDTGTLHDAETAAHQSHAHGTGAGQVLPDLA